MGNKVRLGGLAQKGRCAALSRWFCGVREHIIASPGGMIALIQEAPGNRHDVQGLYGLIKTSFRGLLVGDNAYWPRREKREGLEASGIYILAGTRSDQHFRHPHALAACIKRRCSDLDRWISLFNNEFHGDRTLCRNPRHYLARRCTKAFAFNAARRINQALALPRESFMHFHLVAA